MCAHAITHTHIHSLAYSVNTGLSTLQTTNIVRQEKPDSQVWLPEESLCVGDNEHDVALMADVSNPPLVSQT